MSESKFKTLRHMETVRNYLNACVWELLYRGERHDQSKLESPEVEVFEEFTPKLKDVEYNSPEYKAMTTLMGPAIEHHKLNNRHHPEFFTDGIKGMTLIDLIEMLFDWKASTLRGKDGNIMRSLEIQQERFGYSDELKQIFKNTIKWMDSCDVFHKGEESWGLTKEDIFRYNENEEKYYENRICSRCWGIL